MKKIKIMYINLTSELGGSDVSLFALISALDKNKFDPVVVLPHRGPFDDKYSQIAIPVYHIPMSKLARTFNPLPHLKFVLWFVPSILAIAVLIIRLRVQLVHINSMLNLCPAFSARLTGRPLIWHIRELHTEPMFVANILRGIVLLLAHKVIVISKAVKSQFPRSRRIHLIYNPINIEIFRPSRSTNVQRNGIIVGSIGRITELKQYEILLQAIPIVLQQIPDIRVWIVGWAPPRHEKYLDYLKNLAERLSIGDKTVFWGARQDIPYLLQQFDVYVHTSNHREAFGRTVAEAMAAGKPVVATAAGGVREIVQDSVTGFLIPPRNPKILGCYLLRLLQDKELAAKMGYAGKKRVSELFNVEKHVNMICLLYLRILKNDRFLNYTWTTHGCFNRNSELQ